MTNDEKKPIVLDQELYNRCLEYMRRRRLSEKTMFLYKNALNDIFKSKVLTQTIYNKIFSKSNYYRSVLKLIINTCEYFDLPSYHYKFIPTVKPHRHTPQVWSEREVLRMINDVEKYGLLIACAYYIGAGLRFGSAVMLSWDDFMWEDWIEDKGKTGRCIIKYAKGRKEKVLIVDSILMNRLYNLAEDKGKLFLGIPYKNSAEDLHIFVKQDDIDKRKKIYKKENFENILDDKDEKIDIEARGIMEVIKREHNRVDYKLKKLSLQFNNRKIKFHAIRHTRAITLLKKGIKLLTIKDQLMHESIATTEIYLNMENVDISSEFEEKL